MSATPKAIERAARGSVLATIVAVSACSSSGDDASPGASDPAGPKPPGTTSEQPQSLPPPVLTGPIFLEAVKPTSLGLTALSVNGRIHPHGRACTYWIEYGPTTAYGMQTDPRPLGPRLSAHYHESWDGGLSGWAGGMTSTDLRSLPRGGPLNGYVRFSESSEDDKNHADGVGYVHLTQYLASGTYASQTNGSFGGGDPDFRDARVSFYMRGSNFAPHGSELIFWIQSDLDVSKANDPVLWRKANWGFTGNPLTDHVASGVWEKVSYQLRNDTNAWSYAGRSIAQARDNYVYWSLDDALGHVNSDFIHVLMLIRPGAAAQPSGAIDYDEFDLVYRNTSLLVPSNGGKLVASPPGALDDAATLTDGWRWGDGRSWRSAPNPTTPQEFTYELANPVKITSLQIHQHPEWPSRDVEVSVSDDGKAYKRLFVGELPESREGGPNFAYLNAGELSASARFVKVSVTSGYRAQRWGLGEIEIFGTGAVMQTDDDWYNVNRDLTNLTPGSTVHFRVVAKTSEGTVFGGDQEYTLAAAPMPQVRTGEPSRVRAGFAKVDARVNPMGLATRFHFEYGRDATYGQETVDDYAGVETTPRTVIGEISGLTPGVTYHYRVVAENASGKALGSDHTLVAQ
jgi:hypothetical protein